MYFYWVAAEKFDPHRKKDAGQAASMRYWDGGGAVKVEIARTPPQKSGGASTTERKCSLAGKLEWGLLRLVMRGALAQRGINTSTVSARRFASQDAKEQFKSLAVAHEVRERVSRSKHTCL